MDIEFIGLKSLNDDEIITINRVIRNEMKNIKRDVPNSKVIIRIKKGDIEGRRCRYSLQARLDNPSIQFSAQSEEWDLPKAVHKIFGKLSNEIHRNFKD